VENEYKSNYQFQKKMMYLHQQISEFEKLDIEHKRTKSATWLETEEKYRHLLMQTKKNACIVQDAKVRLVTPNIAELIGYTPEEIIDTLMVHYMDFPHFRGHTEKFDIISSLEVYYGRTERS